MYSILRHSAVFSLILIMIFLHSFGQTSLPSGSTYEDMEIATVDNIARAEFVAIISDYFAWPHPEDYNDIWKVPIDGFNDVSSADAYGKQIEVALEQGIVTKDVSGSFNPEIIITRKEAADILEDAFMVADIVAAGYMEEGEMSDPLSKEEAGIVFKAVTSSVVAPVQAVPVTTAVASRRYIKLWCPTEGATIYFTKDGSEPTIESEV